MEHKIIPALWKSKEGLIEIIKSYQEDGWSVSALGGVFGGNILVLVKDGHHYEHDFVPVLFKTKGKVNALIAEREVDQWQVCAIGECFGSELMILKRKKP